MYMERVFPVRGQRSVVICLFFYFAAFVPSSLLLAFLGSTGLAAGTYAVEFSSLGIGAAAAGFIFPWFGRSLGSTGYYSLSGWERASGSVSGREDA
jgi:hypothetical protein